MKPFGSNTPVDEIRDRMSKERDQTIGVALTTGTRQELIHGPIPAESDSGLRDK